MGRPMNTTMPGARAGFAAIAAAILLAGGTPVVADTTAELDALSKASDKAISGIALARQQIDRDELLEALATLERVLMNNPDNLEARALHAGLLCRVDDRKGAITEFDALRGLDVPPDVNDEAREPCR